MSPDQAGPQELLCRWRSHWETENRLHYVRDVTMKEDASQVRSGAAPQSLPSATTGGDGGLAQHDAGAVAGKPGQPISRRRCDTTATSLWRLWPYWEFLLPENRKTLKVKGRAIALEGGAQFT